jgi:hypothetical protein
LADESSAVTPASPPQATNAATPGVRATAASLEPSLPASHDTARFNVGCDGAVYLYARCEGELRAALICDYDEDDAGRRTDAIVLRWPDGTIQGEPTVNDIARWMRTVAGQPYSGPS